MADTYESPRVCAGILRPSKSSLVVPLATAFALVLSALTLAGCCKWFGDCPDPKPANVTGGWVGFACDASNEGIINAVLNQTDRTVTGSWVIEIPDGGEVFRGEVQGEVVGDQVELVFVQDDPCSGSYQVTGPANDRRLRLSLSGSDCSGTRALELEIGQLGVSISSPCGGSSGPGPNQTPNTLIAALAASSIERTPFVFGPTQQEFALLAQQDQSTAFTLNQFPFTPVYDGTIVGVLNSAGISFTPGGLGLSSIDLLAASQPFNGGFGGGVTGHQYFAMDGKYLGILSELATWRAGRDDGQWGGPPELAVDQIVAAHNQAQGSFPDGLVFSRSSLTPNARANAETWEVYYAAPLVLHEFAHAFGYHSLIRLRAAAGVIPPTVLFTTVTEDEADYIAGALLAKLGIPYSAAQDAYDILNFYVAQRQAPGTSIFNILSPAGQNQSSNNYMSLGSRKQTVRFGFQDMETQLAIIVPTAARLFGSGSTDGPPSFGVSSCACCGDGQTLTFPNVPSSWEPEAIGGLMLR